MDHWTPVHWCGDWWSWVVDCAHLLDPLASPHYGVENVLIRSLAYDLVAQCLEVRYTWNAVTQFRPISLSLVREIWKARPMNVALETLVMKNRRIRFERVRTEGKLLASLLRGWRMIASTEAPL